MSQNTASKEAQLNAIVGAALRGLVEAGASDEAIGAFAQTHRAKIAQVLGITPQAPQVLELPDLVSSMVKAVLNELGVIKPAAKTAQRVFVHVNGDKTSISISHELWEQLLQHKAGDRKAAQSMIEDLANAAPQDTDNRSGWVAGRVEQILSLDQAGGLASSATH